LIHARRVVPGVAIDFDFHLRIHARGNVVSAVRVEHKHFFGRAKSVVEVLIELTQRLPGQIEGNGRSDGARCLCHARHR
jgi:hypothetical protein